MPVEKFKTEKCKVLYYNKNTKKLDVDFSGYGIRLYNVDKYLGNIGDVINVKYRGQIGTGDFEVRL